MRRFRLAMAAAMTAALIVAVPAGAAGRIVNGAQTDSTRAITTVDKAYALVQLSGAPLSTYVKTKPAQGKKIDFTSTTVKSYKALLTATRNDFKAWLQKTAPKAQVVRGYDLSLNAVSVKLNGTSLTTIRTSTLVSRAEYEGVYHPTADDPDLAQISALEGWANAGVGSSTAGAGVKVGVIDTGIDITHPCFSDAGYATVSKKGDARYTNNKVIVARVFNNKLNQNGFDAKAVQEHGSHVAGTIACNYGTQANVGGAAIPYGLSGVAPKALLGSYVVFPGDVENARSEDILNAMEAAYTDGMDVVNMSLGGGAHGVQDLLTVAVDNLDQANLVFAISAGNDGPGHYTVGSPGSAKRALTAGAATVNHQVANPISAGAADAPGVQGEFGVPASFPVTGTLDVTVGTGVSGLNLACEALPAAPADSIALIQRGVCDFAVKLDFAQKAGYKAAIVVNRVDGAPFTMGGSAAASPTIPGWMIGLDEAASFMAEDGSTVSVGAPAYIYPFYDAGVMADFSSQGPTDVDFRVKPDVVSPGVNVLSSIPTSFCDGNPCFAFFQGTSMASPHLAGMAAIVRQQHPTWPAWAVRSAIVNSADVDALEKYTLDGGVVDVNVQGAGKANLASATEAVALLDPVSVSFGSTPSRSGVTKSTTVRILNAGTTTHTWGVGIAAYGPASGVSFSTSVPSVTLAAGASTTFTVNALFAKSALAGDKQAWLTITDGATLVAHSAVYAFVK